MADRSGVEAAAVARLTDGIEPPENRAILVQCLSGELSPSVAIVRMLGLSRDVGALRTAIDHITQNAAKRSRAKDNLVHDRADSLTQLFVDNVRECEAIVAMAEGDRHTSIKKAPVELTEYWDVYSRHLRNRPHSS